MTSIPSPEPSPTNAGKAPLPVPAKGPPQAPREPVPVCLVDSCLEKLADLVATRLEDRLLNSRGASVRAPAHCMQPHGAADIDVVGTGIAVPAADAAGTRYQIGRYECTHPRAVIKGWGFAPVVEGSASIVTDPFSVVRFSLVLNGTPAHPYINETSGQGIGLQILGSVQLLLKEGDVLELVAEKYATSAVPIRVSGRFKGWAWVPTTDMDGVQGAIAF